MDKLIEKGACGNTLNVHLNSLKFLLQEILCKHVLLKIKYSKTPKELPTVLTKEETVMLIYAIKGIEKNVPSYFKAFFCNALN